MPSTTAPSEPETHPSDSDVADFDLDALFDEQCHSETDSRWSPPKKDAEFVLELPPVLPMEKRPLTPPGDLEPAVKRMKFHLPPTLHKPASHRSRSNNLPELLLPEHVISRSLDIEEANNPAVSAITQMKQRMVSAHTLLTTYTTLKRTSAQVTAQLATTNTQLSDANKWRLLLADENSRLRSRVAIVSKEKDRLQVAVTKLNGDTNGLQKNKALRNELKEKNIEISRL